MNRIDAKTPKKEKETGRGIEKLISGKLTGSGDRRRARSNVARGASRMSQQHHKSARELNVPVLQVYRLREKVSSHAIRVFAFKIQPELVASWQQTSLTEHSLGLAPAQWQQYCHSLTPVQRLLSSSKPASPLRQSPKP
jgi:hypothetical protein